MGACEPIKLEDRGNGVFTAPGARIIDRTGRKMLPIGRDGFVPAAQGSVLVDKTMLIGDVLDSGYSVTLFCRPRRFGKTLNMTMMRAFFEEPIPGDLNAQDWTPLFEGTEVWEADGGRYREHQGAYPTIYFSFNTVKKDTWEASYGEIRQLIIDEYVRHGYLGESDSLAAEELEFFRRVKSGNASDVDYAGSLVRLAKMLKAHHRRPVVILIDEYDAPVMAGYSAPDGGYYREVVSFLKGWLTGALKDGGAALAFACMTGVQRISKESIFSDLNNLTVNTALSARFDERFGFTDAEVEALATYLGHGDCMGEAREWYDGYRFGAVDIYNPWSTLNYLDSNCSPGVYWGNTSSNSVIGDLVRRADDETFERIRSLLAPGGVVVEPLDLGVVFPDVGIADTAVWSMLYLAGYLTTDFTQDPNNIMLARPLRVPNKEIAQLYRTEVVGRFGRVAGGRSRLDSLHKALVRGDEERANGELARIARDAASSFDLVSENSCHMLVLGLCFGVPGYADPASNREDGYGRFDVRLEPVYVAPGSLEAYSAQAERPRVTMELKFVKAADAPEGEKALGALLGARAQEALAQIAEGAYDAGELPECAAGRLRWGVAFCGKHVVARCARA